MPYRREDWEFAAAVGHGLVMEWAGEVIGTAMWWNYGEAYASAGMIIVTASAQGGGYGSRLFNGLLEATDGRNVLLNSTEEGLALYERRGFTAWGTVLQHQGWLTAAATPDARNGIRPATVSDLAAIQAFDERATGMPRARSSCRRRAPVSGGTAYSIVMQVLWAKYRSNGCAELPSQACRAALGDPAPPRRFLVCPRAGGALK